MSAFAADTEATALLRLVPDEPDRALALLASARQRSAALADPREQFRLDLVPLHHAARFGDAHGLTSRLHAAAELALVRGWTVEWLHVALIELFLLTLSTRHTEGLRAAEAVSGQAEQHLAPIELAWLDLMTGHFRGYLVGWAEEQQRAYRALRRLARCADAPPGLVANVKKNIGYSHLLVRNLDLARVYLGEAWELYQPLPLTPRKVAAIKAWAQYLLCVGEAAQAAQVIAPVMAAALRPPVPTFLPGALLVAAEIQVSLDDVPAAAACLETARAAGNESHEPSIAVHLAYVEALLLEAQGQIAAAVASAREGCRRIADHDHEVAVQSCLSLCARLHARAGDFRSAYETQCRLLAMRDELARKAADIRHIEMHIDHATRISRSEVDDAQRDKALAEAAEAEIQRRNRQLELRLREVEQSRASLRDLANTDVLTGLPNRRYLAEALPHQLAAAARRTARVSLIIIDLDHFKAVNDRHGHQMGDAVLQGFAALLKQNFRDNDLCCRHGGEEFCVLMCDIDDVSARSRVESLQRLSAQTCFRHGERQIDGQTLSAGMISLTARPGLDLDDIFRQADRALYQAKARGRRCLVAVTGA